MLHVLSTKSRLLGNTLAPLGNCLRKRESSSKWVQTDVDNVTGLGELKLDRAPVNALNLEFIEAILNGITTLEKDGACKGLVLSSGQKVFSAGLDLSEFHRPDVQRFSAFWSALQEMSARLFGTKLATSAAVNGHAIAGGTILMACCDHRVMVRSNKTLCGFNETKFGLVVPRWGIQLFQHRIGHEAEMNLLLGKLFQPEEARDLGLVNELIDDPLHLLPRCREFLVELVKGGSVDAVSMTKLLTRQSLLDNWHEGRKEDLQWARDLVFKESVQNAIDTYLKQLKK